MSLRKLLSSVSVPSDVLQLTAFYLAFKLDSSGVFISIETLEYMNVVVGSFREKRMARTPDGISIADLQDIGNLNRGQGKYIQNNIFVYRTTFDWYVGVDDSKYSNGDLKKIIEETVSLVYPVYKILTEKVEANDPDRDFLTNCYTKSRFYKDIRIALKTMLVKSVPLWLFYMDLNNFKTVNDSLGHLMGDEVLKSISMEIRSIFLGYGNVYRVGGDEFVGMAFGLSRDEAERILKRIENVTFQAPAGIPVSVAVGLEKFEKSVLKVDESNVNTIIDAYIAKAERKMMSRKVFVKSVKNGSSILER